MRSIVREADRRQVFAVGVAYRTYAVGPGVPRVPGSLRLSLDVYTCAYILRATMAAFRNRAVLPAHWFQILLALADRDLHGLAITKDVAERTEGRMTLWPGMLYGALKKMSDAGYVAETQPPASFETGGGRPRFYRITPLGRRVCAAEAERMASFVEAARARKLIKRPRTT